MLIRFWGTRGSIPSPLIPKQVEEKIYQAIVGLPAIDTHNSQAVWAYIHELPPLARGTAGGNTPCVEIQAGGETLILDAGSGLRELGLELLKGGCGCGQGRLHLLISHAHWDHIQGFPFFAPAFIPGNQIFVYSLHNLKAALEDQQRPLNFPVSLSYMRASLEFIPLHEGQPVSIGRVRVNIIQNPHPGRSYSFRIEDQHSVCVYASDAEYKQLDSANLQPQLDFFSNADALIFDAQYTLREGWQKVDWGHSSAMIGVDLARSAGVKKLILFHHDPTYSDAELQKIQSTALAYQAQDAARPTCEVIVAYEGLTIELTPPGAVNVLLTPDGGASVLTPPRLFDELGMGQLAQHLDRLSQSSAFGNSVIDLSQVETLTLAGLKALVSLRQARQEAHIVLAAPSDKIRRMIQLAGYQDYFAIYPSVEAALEAAQARQALNLPGQVIQGRYQIEAKIGESRLGATLKAIDTRADRAVVLKVLSPSFSQETLDHFMRQAHQIVNLDHHHIVKVLGWEQDGDRLFLVEEFVAAPTLQQLLTSNSLLSDVQVLGIAVDVARALEYAHSRGVIHGNLKPRDIFLTTDGVKLNGFGLGRLAEGRSLLDAPRLLLSPTCLAPEQILGQPLDARTDLYALGVILHQLLTGRLPFEGSDQEVLRAHLNQTPRPPRELNPLISPSMDHLILKLLAKDPNDRYASAQQARRISSSLIVHAEEITGPRASPLVGRDEQMRVLQTCWQQARAGQGQLVFISGEPGIGKTRLAQQIAAQSQAAVRLFGHSQELENAPPYHLFAQVLGCYFATAPPEVLDEQAQQAMAGFIRLTPEIRQMLPELPEPPALEPEQEQLRLMGSLTQFVKRATQERPWLLVLDDLQWADPNSLAILSYLGRQAPSMAILIIGTYRDSEVKPEHPLQKTMHALRSLAAFHHIALDRLDEAAVGQILRHLWQQAVPAAFTAKIYQHTEGNPFYVEEIAKGLVDDGLIQLQEGSWQFPALEELCLPPSVQEVVWRRIGHLSSGAQALLRQASVLGHIFRFDDLREMSGLSEWQVLEYLDMALERQLVLEALAHHSPGLPHPKQAAALARQQEHALPGQALLRFRHIEIQQVLYEDLGPLRRRLLHRQAGEALERRAQPEPERIAEQLAYHFSQAGELEHALVYSLPAAQQAQVAYANKSALLWYSKSLAMLDQLDPERVHFQSLRLPTHQSLADVLILMARYDEALAQLGTALALLESEPLAGGQPRQLANLCYQLACAQEGRGEYALAIEQLEKGLSYLAKDEPTPEAARLYYLWGLIHTQQGHYAPAQAMLERALSQAQAAHLRQVEADSWRALGLVSYYQSRYGHAKMCYEQAMSHHVAMGDRLGEGRVLGNLGDLSAEMGEARRAIGFYEQALAVARQIGNRRGEGYTLSNLGIFYTNLGELDQAIHAHEQALTIAREIDNRMSEGQALCNLGDALAKLGESRRASIAFEQALALMREAGNRRYECIIEGNLGGIYADLGEPHRAIEFLEQALAMAREMGDRRAEGYVLTSLGHALADLGQLPQAAQAYQQAVDLRRSLGVQALTVESLAGLAQTRLAEGKVAEAAATVEDVLSYLEEHALQGVEDPYHIYLACYNVLKASHDPRAENLLETAYALLQEQAAKIADPAARRLFLDGARPRRELAQAYEHRTAV